MSKPASRLRRWTTRVLLALVPLALAAFYLLYPYLPLEPAPGRPETPLQRVFCWVRPYPHGAVDDPVAYPVDFSAYYIGGAAVAWKIPESLYPIPRGELPHPAPIQRFRRFAGDSLPLLAHNSYLPEKLCSQLYLRGATRLSAYVNPPVLAPFLAPLAHLDFIPALRAWQILCALALALAAALTLLDCCARGAPAWLSALFVLVAFFSRPIALEAVWATNLACFLALAGALFVFSVRRGARARGGVARQGWAAGEAVGAVALAVGKLYAAPWVPLYILRRRWRAAAWGAVLSAAVFAATLPAVGWRSYGTFFLRVAPAMFRGGGFEGWNTGFLTPALAKILPAGLVWKACDWGLILSLLAVYGAAWRRPPLPSAREENAAFLRFCAAALAAFVVFRPLSWGYTYTAILPFVPATAEALWRRAKILCAAYAAGWLWLLLPLTLVLPAGANVFPRAVALLAVLGGFLAAAVLPERAADRPAGPVSA